MDCFLTYLWALSVVLAFMLGMAVQHWRDRQPPSGNGGAGGNGEEIPSVRVAL